MRSRAPQGRKVPLALPARPVLRGLPVYRARKGRKGPRVPGNLRTYLPLSALLLRGLGLPAMLRRL
jgi:hypothetical protein